MIDLNSRIKVLPDTTLASGVVTKNATNGSGVDIASVLGASLAVVFNIGTVTDGTHALKIQDSDDNTTFADVAAPYLTGTALTSVTSGASAGSNTVQQVGYAGVKRYVRGVVTPSGSPSTGAAISVVYIVGPRVNMP